MNKEKARERIKKLSAEINGLRYRYHVLDDPTVTDEVYDSLTKELKILEDEYPELREFDSPLGRIGGKPLDKFVKVKHEVAQWSFNDCFSVEELKDFDERVKRMIQKEIGVIEKNIAYAAELKIDGLHIVFTYERGLLKLAATRGDGAIGEDVTQNIKTIQSVPLRLSQPVDIIVEGEVWLSTDNFNKLNQERQKKGEPLFANPRNAAAGTIRQLDPKIVAERKLDCFVYDLSLIKNDTLSEPKTQIDELELLETLGFKVNKNRKLCSRVEDIVSFWQVWQKKKSQEKYWIDGLVIKINQRDWQQKLGYTGKAPRWAIAFKFPAERATTIVENIKVQVGRTGALTPVAHLKPVLVAGSIISRATLHNEDEIERLDVRVSDTVVIQKAGDVIPDIIEVLKNLRTGNEKKFKMPDKCPVCGARAARQEGEAAYYCTNKDCPARSQERLYHFVSKSAFNIEKLGPKIIDQLIKAGLVNDAVDFFTLRKEDLESLERFAEKSARNLIEAIAAKKEISLERFIYALGIRYVGEETSILLAQILTDDKRLTTDNFIETVRSLTLEDLMKIDGVGEKVAQSLYEWFHNERNINFVKKLFSHGVRLKVESSQSSVMGRFSGKTFILTGTLKNLSRDEAKQKIRSLGGDISEGVSKKIDYLIVGANPGSKLNKAKEFGIKILEEKEFIKLIS